MIPSEGREGSQRDHGGDFGPIPADLHPWNSPLTRGDAENGLCPRGDLNQLNGRSTSGFRTS